MKTLLKYKYALIFPLLLLAFMFSSSSVDPALNDNLLFNLDLSDHSQFSITGNAEITKNAWLVKNKKSELVFNEIYLPGISGIDSNMDVPITFSIDQSGNLETDNFLAFYYKTDKQWMLIDSLSGPILNKTKGPNTYLIKNIEAGSYLTVKITASTLLSGKRGNAAWVKILSGKNGITAVGTPLLSGTNKKFGENLPATLTQFFAVAEGEEIRIKWTTTSEKNLKHFILEKSVNGLDFFEIAKIKAAGNSKTLKNYSVTDNNVESTNTYYRLREIQLSDVAEFSDILTLNTKSNDKSVCLMTVNPDPCIGKCILKFDHCQNKTLEKLNFNTFDILGNVISSQVKNSDFAKPGLLACNEKNYIRPGIYILKGIGDIALDKKIYIEK